MPLVADGGRLATITSDPPDSQRGITVSNCYVSPDEEALDELAADFAARRLTIPIASVYGLLEAGTALAAAVARQTAGGVVIHPSRRAKPQVTNGCVVLQRSETPNPDDRIRRNTQIVGREY